ncbi:MAG: ABC transporter substrate-binding protein [Desulfobacter sp.]|nr:MAG: ABC transporter substrate-binding protein [Desulfobacter sp.]
MNLRISSATMILVLLAASIPAFAGTARVGAIFSKTGKSVLDNASTLNGIRLAIDELNQNGGVLGRQIELIEFDNQSTALGSKRAAREAVKAGVVAVFGAIYSTHSLAMAPVLQAAAIPMISPYSTHTDLTRVGDYIFRVCYTDPFQGKIMANFAFQDMKTRTAGILVNANRKYSESLAKFFDQSYTQLGGKIVFTGNYLGTTVDFTPLLEKIKQFMPEVIFMPGSSKEAGLLISQARAQGIQIPFLGGDGWNDSIYEIMGDVIEGNYYSNHWHPEKQGEKSRKLVIKYQAEFGKIDPGVALANDCVYLFADAVRRAGSFDPKRIRDAIAETRDFQGVTGVISFDKNGDPIKPAVILKFEKGTSVYVKTVRP